MKNEMIKELDNRIKKLENHQHDDDYRQENPYDNVRQAVSFVINDALLMELKDLKDFASHLDN
ncbi:hypothetical protein [Zongyangia hominis]|uniref:Uncharacterized protein n=1 Tax=Zongyangia hominis TaxID=2763677 RepID=A0A926IAW4_9FIRM|nr:hypothetical protein [Zongyangia hominis]MBC8569537.1 hypothetical protein [Zongyangia hominis]